MEAYLDRSSDYGSCLDIELYHEVSWLALGSLHCKLKSERSPAKINIYLSVKAEGNTTINRFPSLKSMDDVRRMDIELSERDWHRLFERGLVMCTEDSLRLMIQEKSLLH